MKSIYLALFIGLLLVFVNAKFSAAQTTKSASKYPAKITQAAIAQKITAAGSKPNPTAAPVATQKQTAFPTTLPPSIKPTSIPSTVKPPRTVPVTTQKPAVTTAAKSG